MYPRILFFLGIILTLSSLGYSQPCPTLTGPAATAGPFCAGDVVTLSMSGGMNLIPGAQTVDWYASSSPSFTPPAQGNYIGSAAINGSTGGGPCGGNPPFILGAIVNPCTAAGNTGSNPGSEENEAVFIWSGGGFDAASFGMEVNNNIMTGGQDNIGVLGACPLLASPSVPVLGSCVVLGGPTTVVPPNAFVLVFTSSLADLSLDVSLACALGFPVYVFQSSCSRGSSGNVPGAFTNGSGGPYNAEFGCPGPNQSLSYFGVPGNNTTIAGWALGPIGVPAPCGSLPAFPTPPTTGVTTTIDPLDYTVQASDCPGPLYFSAVVAPPVPGCPSSATTPIQVALDCPEVALSIQGSVTACVGEAIDFLFVDVVSSTPPPYTHEIFVNGTSIGVFSTSNDPFLVPYTPSTAGPVTVTVSSTLGMCGSNVSAAGVTFNVTPSAPVNPLGANICEGEQPLNLTALEDPAYPGGSWSGTGVTGNIFNVGPGAAGSYSLTYTPPAGASCVTPGSSTVTVTANQQVPLATGLSFCPGEDFLADILLLPGAPAGTFSSPFYSASSGVITIPANQTSDLTVGFVPADPCFDPVTITVVVDPQVAPILGSANICQNEQPYDLTQLEDPSFPGGTWSGPGASGSIFNAGPGASGTFTITYTPPSGGSCASTATTTIAVTAGGTASPLDVTLCETAGTEVLAPYEDPALPGGSWSGPFVVNGTELQGPFTPGTYILTYSPPAASGCATAGTSTLTINPNAQLQLGSATVCETDPPLDLFTLEDPSGPFGTWSGPGVSGSAFDPSATGAGQVTLTFTPDAGTCFGVSTTTITVNAEQPVALLTQTVCVNDPPFALNTLFAATPTVGSWSGMGVAGAQFVPSAVTAGNYTLTFTPSSGCFTVATTTITVLAGGTPVLTTATVCESASAFDLTSLQDPSFPSGTWLGPGVSGNSFNASAVGPGTTMLTFTPSGGACFQSATTTIEVEAALSVVLGMPAAVCANAGPLNLGSYVDPLVPNGSWSGPGVSGNSFSPSTAGVGTHTLTFIPTAGSCATPGTTTITVLASDPVMLLSTSVCPGSGPVNLNTLISSGVLVGTWSGTGVSGNNFAPGSLAPGSYTLTFTPSNTCTPPATTTVTIQSGGMPTLAPGVACVGGANLDLTTLQDPSFGAGNWTGVGVSGSQFDPSGLAAGDYTLTFTPSGGACLQPASTLVSVEAPVTPNLSTGSVCASATSFDLNTLEDPLYTNGTWSGPGVTADAIDPSALGAGVYTYTFSASAACAQATSTTVTIAPAGPIMLLSPAACADSGPINLNTLIVGGAVPGTWSGANVSGSSFSTAGLSDGSYTVTFVPSAGCASTNSTTITIQSVGVVSLLAVNLCVTAAPYDLVQLQDPAYPTGTWSGPGVTGTTFDAGAAGLGTHRLTFTPPGSCIIPGFTNVLVLAPQVLSLPAQSLCVGSAPLDLTALVPQPYAGGTWSGGGVSGSTFTPATAGSFTLTYTPPVASCGLPSTLQVTVTPTTTPMLVQGTVLCADAGPTLLSSLADPSFPNGTWSGVGVLGSILNPAVGPIGIRTLTFVPTNGCAAPATVDVDVQAVGTPMLSSFDICISVASVDLNALEDPGYTSGSWSGTGVSGSTFTPSTAGVGSTVLTFTPAGGCAEQAFTTVSVSALSATGVRDTVVCSGQGSFVLSTLLQNPTQLGSWSGPAVAGSVFNLAAAPLGATTVTFTPAPNECASAATSVITVEAAGAPSLTPQTVCSSSPSINLTSLVPAGFRGGTWSGPAVTGNTFDPALAGAGTSLLIYTPPGSCAQAASLVIDVVSSVTLSVAPLEFCIDAGIIDLSAFDPTAAPGGVWSGPGVSAGLLEVSIAGAGNHTLSYMPPAGSCATGAATAPLSISPLLVPGIPVDTVCAADGPIDLAAIIDPSFALGTWSGASVTPAGVFNPTNFDSSDAVTFTPTAGCYTQAQFTFDLVGVSPLSYSGPSFTCAPDNQTYTATLDLSYATNNGQITSNLGTLTGTLLIVANLASGGASTLTIDDAATCTPSLTVALNHSCGASVACTTDAGTLTGGPYELCETDQLSPNATVGFVNDGDDVLVYVLDEDSDPSNGLIETATSIDFDLPVGFANQQLFVYAYAGDDDGAGNVLTSDTCATTSNALRVRWSSNPMVTAQAPVCNQAGDAYDQSFVVTGGLPPYTAVGTSTPGAFLADGVTYVVSGTASGGSINVQFASATGCTSSILTEQHDCASSACTTEVGTLSSAPLEACENEQISIMPPSGTVLDGDDVLHYFLDDDQDFANGTLLSNASSNVFSMPIGGLGQTFYVFAVAGNAHPTTGVDLQDTCLAVSNSVAVRWLPRAGGTVTVECSPDNTTYTATIALSGGTSGFILVAGSGGSFNADSTIYTRAGIPAGTTQTFGFTSQTTCDTFAPSVQAACTPSGCTPPNPGTFAAGPVLLCPPHTSNGGYNNDADSGAGLVQQFVIFSDAAGTNELGRLGSLPIDFSLYAIPGETVYLASLVGEDDGTGQVGTDCFALSALQAITLQAGVSLVVNPTLCPGESRVFGGTTFDQSNPTGTIVLPGTGTECDTTLTVALSYTSGNDTVTVRRSICFGETVEVGGRTFDASNLSAMFQAGNAACPTTYIVDLTLLSQGGSMRTDTLCFGEQLMLGGTTFSSANPSGSVTLFTEAGCDSVVMVDLTFIERIEVSLAGEPRYCNPAEISLDIEVTGGRGVTGNVFINGRADGSQRLEPGITTLTYPTLADFNFAIRGLTADGAGCQAPNVPTLAYNPTISRLDASINMPAGGFVACGDNPAELISAQTGPGIGPYQFSWSTGATTSSIEDVPAGDYSVQIIDAFGCVDTAFVTVGEVDTLGYSATVFDPLCDEGTGSVSVSLDDLPNGLQFRFDVNGLEPALSADFTFDNLEEGTYVFQLVQENGCQQFELFTLTDPPTLNLLKQDTVQIALGDSVLLNADVPDDSVVFDWDPGDHLACDTCSRTLASPPNDILYTATLETSNGCIVTDQIFVEVLPVTEIFIPTAFSPNQDGVNDILTVYGGPAVERINSLLVFDRWGEQVHESRDFLPSEVAFGWDGRFRGEFMNPAVFVVVAEVLFRNGTVKTFSSDVALMR